MKKPIQYILLLLSLLLYNGYRCYSQLTVDAGPDSIYCVGVYFDTMYIAPKLHIENGTEPYTYAWEGKIVYGGYLTFWASSFLSDTTIANPFFTSYQSKGSYIWLTLYINVWDADENYAKDSINFRFSSYIYYTLGYDRYLAKGDSFQFFLGPMIGEGIEPVTHCYIPEYGLTDPCSVSTWCKPDTTTYYYEYATDSMGCVSESTLVYRVFVYPLTSDNITETDFDSGIRKTGDKIIFSNPQHKPAQIVIYSITGSVVYSAQTRQDYLFIPDLSAMHGIYIVTIRMDNEILSSKIKF